MDYNKAFDTEIARYSTKTKHRYIKITEYLMARMRVDNSLSKEIEWGVRR